MADKKVYVTTENLKKIIKGTKTPVDTSISSTSTDAHVPSAKAVYSYINSIHHITKKKVDTLPETGEDDIIYLVASTKTSEGNALSEYMWLDGKWELIGTTASEIDIDDYITGMTDAEVTALINEINSAT